MGRIAELFFLIFHFGDLLIKPYDLPVFILSRVCRRAAAFSEGSILLRF
jgi:hypothetical protein